MAASGWRLGNANEQRETGLDGAGTHFQVSGLSHQVPGTGAQVQVREICPLPALSDRPSHLSSVIDLAIHSFRVAGGSPGWQASGLFHSALHSVLNAVLCPSLPGKICPLSSAIDSVIRSFRVAGGSPGWQVAAPGGRWRDFSIQPSTRSFSPLQSIQSSIRPSIQQLYVVTRSRPYQGKLGQHAVLPLPQGMHSPDTR